MPRTADDLDRTLTRLISACGLAIGLLWLLETLLRSSRPAAWWVLAYAAFFAVLAALTVLAPRIPMPMLRWAWTGIPAIGFALQVATFPAHVAPLPERTWEYSWMLTGVLLCFLVLRVPPGRRFVRINVIAALAAFLPALSYLLAAGALPVDLWSTAMVQFTNVTYPMLLIEMRTRLVAYRRLQERWRERVIDAAVVRAKLHEERRLGRLVHDDVLGVLTAAAWTRGDIDVDLRAAARAAGSPLERTEDTATEEYAVEHVATLLSDALLAVDPAQDLHIDVGSGTLPEACVTAMIEAGIEAVRNSLKHAPGARRVVRISLSADDVTAMIVDDGPGFTRELVPADRLGVSASILGRLGDLRGGAAELETEPGTGTVVRLSWRRCEEFA